MDMSICRSCLSSASLKMYTMDDILEDITIDVAFEYCTNLSKICTDPDVNIPQVICEVCVKDLHSAYNFCKRSKRSHDLFLRKVIRKIEIQEGTGVTSRTAFLIPIEDGAPDQFFVVEEANNSNSKEDHDYSLDCRQIDADEIISRQHTDEKQGCLDAVAGDDVKEEDADDPYDDVDNFIAMENVKEEKKSYITTAPKFKCSGCIKVFVSVKRLVTHVEKCHQEQSKLTCNYCGKLCSSHASFVEHKTTHPGKFDCTLCDKTYQTRSGLINHMQIHGPQIKRPARYLCSVCGRKCATHQRLQVHTLTHTGEKNFHCDICARAFATDFRLRSHRRIHTNERPYECNICLMTFKQGNALKCHKRTHTGEKPFQCKFCDKSFSQNTILKTHMTLHTGKTIQCDKCDKKFSRRSYLIMHAREHTGEKPYACIKCPNRYKQKSHLDRHMDTHMGVKHICETCGKEYSKQWSLKMHMFVHQDKKPYECKLCVASFFRKDKYRAHLLNFHPDPVAV